MSSNIQRALKVFSVAACLVATPTTFKYVVAAENIPAALASERQPVVAELSISASEVDFGEVSPGEAQSAIVVFENTGTSESGSIVIDNFFLDELDSKYFTLSTNGPITLAPSESVDLLIGFEPDKLGLITGMLTVSHSGKSGVDSIDLSGEGAEAPALGAALPSSLPFGKSNLVGYLGGKPTSLQYGPDGRLYVATMYGDIHVLDIERNAANNYVVTGSEDITLVKTIPNHNDDGSVKTGLDKRLVTGLLVSGTASNPLVYVLSSDPRIGGGHSGNTTGLDTNSGVLSRLSKTSNGWQKLDLVRGLPRSEENHHTNGMALVGSTLYVGAGGHTNMGAKSNNFALLPEYALSAAILSIDLEQIGESTYDLPTLDDEDRSGPDDYNDPFGGNGGKNQAMIVAGGPVQVYSPGFRNPYDIVVMRNGRMYSWDNGPNSGWGGAPAGCFNAVIEPGSTQHDALHLISGPGYYAGHPNPTRGDQKNTFNRKNPQSPVPYGNSVECNYYGPGTSGTGKHPNNNSLVSLPRSTNGITEYTASNLSGALSGDLLAVSWNKKVYRVSFDESGGLDEMTVLFSNVGVSPIDVTAQSDDAIFPGTIWVADFQSQDVIVYEPGDYEGGGSGGGSCVISGGNGDADDDGFSNADELANGTDGCSAADVPADADGDFISDLIDNDDDNDNILDVNDPFAIDPSNGASTQLPVDYQWENDSPDPGFIERLGFTGLMTNGVDSYQTQYDLNEMTIIGAAGVVTVDNVPDGDPIRRRNSQQYGFQFGVDVGPDSEIFRAQTRILAPFSGFSPDLYQSMGLFIGTGDQDNYLKLTVMHNGVQVLSEVEGSVRFDQIDSLNVTGSDYVDLTLEIDPTSAIATAFFQITRNEQSEQEVQVASVDFPATWLSGSTKLAVGIISTSTAAEPFPATWDFLTVKPLSGGVVNLNQAPVVSIPVMGDVMAGAKTTITSIVTDDGLPSNDVDYRWSLLSGPVAVVSMADSTQKTTEISFSEVGTYRLQLSADDGEYTETATVDVNVISDAATAGNVVYRINAGGPMLSAEDGNWLSDSAGSEYVNTGKIWKSNATIDVSDITTAVPAQLFNTERYDPVSGPDLEWELPVTPGVYIVRLYFSELFFGAMKVGGRVFDLDVEGQSESGIDVFANVGANKAMMKSFTVQADDTIDISFTHVTQNPAIKGIEVLRTADSGTSSSNLPPVVNAGADVNAQVSDAVRLSGNVSDDGLPANTIANSWSFVRGPATPQFSSANSADTQVSFPAAGEYVLRLTATDSQLSGFDELTINVEAAPVVVYRINAGGPRLTDSTGNWASDIGSSSMANTGRSYSVSVPVNADATPHVPAALFQSERWDRNGGPALSWQLPVTPGRYDVRLYFAETFSGAMSNGKRVFNVTVEGQSNDALDVYAEVGGNRGLVKTFSADITDGAIDISFDHVIENPSIKGIEVLKRP